MSIADASPQSPAAAGGLPAAAEAEEAAAETSLCLRELALAHCAAPDKSQRVVFEESDPTDLAHMPAPSVVSDPGVQRIMEKLLFWQEGDAVLDQDKAKAEGLFQYIEGARKQLLTDQKVALEVQEQMRQLQHAFREREEKMKAEISRRRERLLGMEAEKNELREVLQSATQTLQQLREEKDRLIREQCADRERWSAEEAKDRAELPKVITHGRMLRRRLEELEERSHFLKDENERTRLRTKVLRENILLI